MTLRWQNIRGYYTVPDSFAVTSRGWYICNGLSITTDGQRVERNEHKVTKCLALTSDLAVVVTRKDNEDRCVLLQKGKEKMPITIRSWGQEVYPTGREQFESVFKKHPALSEWYNLSRQTIETLLNKSIAKERRQDACICAAGHQWLIWEGAASISIGNKQTLLGSIPMPTELQNVNFDVVAFAPVQKGWLIQCPQKNIGLALLWESGRIKQQSIVVPPCAEWEELNGWRCWDVGGVILTTSNNMVLVPTDYHGCLLKAAHPESAFFITRIGGAFSVHQSGQLSVCFPNKLSNKFAVGKTHCMLYQDSLSTEVSPFVIARIDRFPCQIMYELDALPDHVERFVEVLEGNPETFVILFACSEQRAFPSFHYEWGVAFISADGWMNIIPSVLEGPGLPSVINLGKKMLVYIHNRPHKNVNADLCIEVHGRRGIIHWPELEMTALALINQPLANWSQAIREALVSAD